MSFKFRFKYSHIQCEMWADRVHVDGAAELNVCLLIDVLLLKLTGKSEVLKSENMLQMVLHQSAKASSPERVLFQQLTLICCYYY